jgi:hypothetical protein
VALVDTAAVARRGRLAIPRVDSGIVVYAAALACIPLSFIVYWPRVNDYFVFDDYLNLATVRNHSFPAGMVRAFNFTVPRHLDPAIPSWRPLIDIYFYAAKPLGLHSQPFHVVNFALHGMVGGLAVLLLYRLQRAMLPAVATGLLFVVAPTYDYAVSWIGQVSELLGYALVLIALNAYYGFLTTRRRSPALAAAALGCVFLALLTKESTVIVALLLPGLVFVLPSRGLRRTRAEIAWSLGPMLVIIATFVVVMQAANAILKQTPDHFFGPHVAHNWWRFLEWIVLPYRAGDFMVLRELLASAFVICGVVGVLLRLRLLTLLFIWTAAAIVPFAMYNHAIELRYTYLPTLPFIAFVVVGLHSLAQRLPQPATRAGYLLIAGAALIALVVAPMRTRDAQAGIAFQAHHYELMVNGVRNLCGPMAPGNHVWVVGSPIIDYFGLNTSTALSLHYKALNAVAVAQLPGLAAFIEEKCVIQYDAGSGTYARVG